MPVTSNQPNVQAAIDQFLLTQQNRATNAATGSRGLARTLDVPRAGIPMTPIPGRQAVGAGIPQGMLGPRFDAQDQFEIQSIVQAAQREFPGMRTITQVSQDPNIPGPIKGAAFEILRRSPQGAPSIQDVGGVPQAQAQAPQQRAQPRAPQAQAQVGGPLADFNDPRVQAAMAEARPTPAIEPEAEREARKSSAFDWSDLMASGLGMAASDSPFFLQALAQGGQAGLANIKSRKAQEVTERKLRAAEAPKPSKKLQEVDGITRRIMETEKLSKQEALPKALIQVYGRETSREKVMRAVIAAIATDITGVIDKKEALNDSMALYDAQQATQTKSQVPGAISYTRRKDR